MSKKRRRPPGRKEAASDADLRHADDELIVDDVLDADEVIESDDGLDVTRDDLPEGETPENHEADDGTRADAEPEPQSEPDDEAEPEPDPEPEPEPEPEEIIESDEGLTVVRDWDDTGDDLAADTPGSDELVSRLELIGAQPLGERADALAQVHDELRTRLESGDSPRPSA